MSKTLLTTGGWLSLVLALFKMAMPYLFHWQEAMSSSAASMWATLYAENLAVSLLLIYFAWMSFFHWQELLESSLGRTVMLAIVTLYLIRTAAELLLYRIGADGAWWRVILFVVIAGLCLVPLISTSQRLKGTFPSRIIR